METDEGVKARCPACGWWLTKIVSTQAKFEVNCSNWNCRTPVLITREGGSVTTTALPKQKLTQQA